MISICISLTAAEPLVPSNVNAASILTSLGFTAEEQKILKDYCAYADGPTSFIAVVAHSLATTCWV